MVDQNLLWDKVKDFLAANKKISAEIFNFYIGPSKINKFSDEEIIVEVNTNFAKEIFMQNLTLIKEVLVDEVGENIAIHFLLPGEIVKAQSENFKTENLKNELKTDIEATKTFENFIKGSSNNEAYLASYSVSKKLGDNWNPLFIYGSSGLGKTHLLTAIANKIKELKPDTKILFWESSYLGKKVIDVIPEGHRAIEEFKNKIIGSDVLILDDIQMIATWDKTNGILFEIFNHFIKHNKQIVFSSDKYPDNLHGFERRMISRFSHGLSVGVTAPDFETAIQIIRAKLKTQKILNLITENAVEFLALHFRDDVRSIEGAIKRILFAIVVYKYKRVGLEQVQEIFNNIDFKKEERISYQKILNIVAYQLNIPEVNILGRDRVRETTRARKIAIYFIRTITNDPYQQIAKFFKRDHSTIITSFKQISAKIRTDANFKKEINNLRELITQH